MPLAVTREETEPQTYTCLGARCPGLPYSTPHPATCARVGLAEQRADRRAIAADLRARAGEAEREAEAHEKQMTGKDGDDFDDAGHRDRASHCEGQAAALRAYADMLDPPEVVG